MNQPLPWYEIALNSRWRKNAAGWCAPLPELADLLAVEAGETSPLLVLEDGTPVPPAAAAGAPGVWFQGDQLLICPPDGSDPTGNGRDYVATLQSLPSPLFRGHRQLILYTVRAPFERRSNGWIAALPNFAPPRADGWNPTGSPLVVLENGAPIDRGRIVDRRALGRGHVLHLPDDGTDPNAGGHTYAIAVVTIDDWPVPVVRWPADGPFRHLGTGLELPIYVSMGLTNKCNLRCAICGSQSTLDREKSPRRFTEIDFVRRIAATTFPFAREVELNSFGEPTLHEDFAEIVDLVNRYSCLLKVQTNGTLLRPRLIETLKKSRGFVWLSVDATGELFERVRKHGRWADVDAGVRHLMRECNPRHLRVGLYPTVTRTTLPAMVDVVEWAHDVGIETVRFHLYDPIARGTEERPEAHEVEAEAERLRAWLARNPDGPDVQIGLDWLKYSHKDRVAEEWGKMPISNYHSHPVRRSHDFAHPDHVCRAPWQQLNFDLDGEINACCRSMERLGRADTVAAFCATWFGPQYEALRSSMRRSHTGDMVLPECSLCIWSHFDPAAASVESGRAMLSGGEVSLRPLFERESDNCFLIELPGELALNGDSAERPQQSSWLLFEDDRRLGPAHALHDTIRTTGKGTYSHWGRHLYFSTSDNSDPNRNRRVYRLRRRQDIRPPLWRIMAGLVSKWLNVALTDDGGLGRSLRCARPVATVPPHRS